MKLLLLLLLLTLKPAWAKLEHESEISVINTQGNSELQSYNLLTKNKYNFTQNALLFGGHYTYGEANNSLSARNWDFNLKYDFALNERLAVTLAETLEGNRFQDVKTRYNSDLGLRYSLVKTDKQSWFVEGAYRYAIEDRYTTENLYQHKGRTYTEWNRKHNETLQWKTWLEYIPNFSDGHDWMMSGEASATAIMTSLFSLKVAYKGLYDNQPANSDLKNYDSIITTSLVAKF